jgi:hypothetical protein
MDISLAPEQAFYFIPRFSPEVAQDRVDCRRWQETGQPDQGHADA